MTIKFVAAVISLVKFDICYLELEYVSWSHNMLVGHIICESVTQELER